VKVRGLADILTNSATVARRGAEQLDYLKRQAIDAIEEAREAGFTVSEDLSVTTPANTADCVLPQCVSLRPPSLPAPPS